MKALCLTAVLILCALPALQGQAPNGKKETARKTLNLAELKAVPDGNYLVTLEHEGEVKRFNLRVDANNGKVVKSSDPAFMRIEASFKPYDREGRFLARLVGGTFATTQLWIMRPDGTAAIREAPDRGEMQTAVPVVGETLEAPETKK